jgi:hypothetical protein
MELRHTRTGARTFSLATLHLERMFAGPKPAEVVQSSGSDVMTWCNKPVNNRGDECANDTREDPGSCRHSHATPALKQVRSETSEQAQP